MEQREAEFWDALPDGVVIADGDGTVVLVNAPAREMLGDQARVGAALERAITLQDQDAADWFGVVRPFEGLGTRSGVPEQSWLLPDGSEVLVTTRLQRSARKRAFFTKLREITGGLE